MSLGYSFDDAEAFLSSLNTERPGSESSNLSTLLDFENSSGLDEYTKADIKIEDEINDWIDYGALQQKYVPQTTDDTPESNNESMPMVSPPDSSTSMSETSSINAKRATTNSKITKVKKERHSHNVVEKKYRMNINNKILELRNAVPSLRAASGDKRIAPQDLDGLSPALKLNKANILAKATEYIRHLESKNAYLMNEIHMLRSSLDSQMANSYSQQTQYFSPEMQPQPQQSQYPDQNQEYVMNSSSVPVSSKLLMGGMTAMVGTQLFDGFSDESFKGLFLVPLHRIFPILGSPQASVALNYLRTLLFFGGLFLLLQPLYQFFTTPKEKAPAPLRTAFDVSLWELALDSLKMLGVKLRLLKLDLTEELNGIKSLNLYFEKWLVNTLSNQETMSYSTIWRPFFKYYIQSLGIDGRINEVVKSDATIQFHFNRLIVSKMVMTKVGEPLSTFLGLQRILDSLMLGMVKDLKQIKDTTKFSDETTRILKFVSNDIAFLDSAELFEKLSDVLKWRETNNNGSYIEEFLRNSEDSDLSLINLICAIRSSQILNNLMKEYLSQLAESTSESEDSGGAQVDADTIYDKINSDSLMIPPACVKLQRLRIVLNSLLKPTAENSRQTLEVVISAVKDVVEFSEAIEQIEPLQQEDSGVEDPTISKILQFAHQPLRPSKLTNDETRLTITCVLMLYFFENGQASQACRLVRFLSLSQSTETVSLLTLISVLRAVGALIDHLDLLEGDSHSRQTAGSLVAFLRLHVGSTTKPSLASKSAADNSYHQLVDDAIDYEVRDLDVELKSDVSHKLVCLGRQLLGDTEI
ncbi:hypothetical protein KL949_004470 [Ogataea haglerorum]|nr:hypothetical protein KL913_004567 [Ogataea haglerorum]KAG7715077.1 hypothetical protein KL949_004470 [Ogataea haglerorum]KAG7735660.1 hypothetical protein KL932_004324 [Ogataea haglerorum]KAG7755081.1 hypothetical protein KL947_004575 [Ogataea haglerorum]KAG7763382.1 hypothetical protein KL931_005056 [Ogataea haglerorum]